MCEPRARPSGNTSGGEAGAAHGTLCCPIAAPPAAGNPSASTSWATSAVGPTRSEVPVSAIALGAAFTLWPPRVMPPSSNCQYAFRVTGA